MELENQELRRATDILAVYARGSGGDCLDRLTIGLEVPLGGRVLIDLYDGEPIRTELDS